MDYQLLLNCNKVYRASPLLSYLTTRTSVWDYSGSLGVQGHFGNKLWTEEKQDIKTHTMT
jgi:hypothetical protein